MIQLVAPEKEPITPFVQLVRTLYEEIGLSSILVIGGSGDFFSVCDNVLVLDSYRVSDATERAKEIAGGTAAVAHRCQSGVFQKIQAGGKRFPVGSAYDAGGKVKVMSKIVVSYGDTELNLAGLEQLVSKCQTNAISAALQRIAKTPNSGNVSIEELLNQVENSLATDGLSDALAPGQFNGALAKPRRLELAAAINRLRRAGSIIQR